MPILEEEYYDSDSSVDEESHSRLLSSVSQLDSTQRVKPTSRKEVSSEVSEYNLTKGSLTNKNFVKIEELAKVLGKKSGHVSIKKKVNSVTKKSKTLPKPLEKTAEEKLKRSIGFEKVKSQLKRWDAVVSKNALKDNIKFPLKDNSMKMQESSSEFLKQFRTCTPLEMDISKILKLDTVVEKEEINDEFPLSLEEMMEKRKEMAQLRAKLSYKEAKAQRQSKIKSKKYHRILKREKLRQQLKEFELLQKTDPEAALKKLSELDKTRAQERASLRHRNTGQWAKNLTVRAKYDIESRKVLAEQLKMSREMTQKVHKSDSSDEEESTELPSSTKSFYDQHLANNHNNNKSDNPWSINVSEEFADFVSGYKKYWDTKNKEISKEIEDEKGNETNKINLKKDMNPLDMEKKGSNSEESNNCEILEKEPSKPGDAKNDTTLVATKKQKNVKNTNCESKTPEKHIQNKNMSFVSIHPASGVWIVTPTINENKSDTLKKKRKVEDVDSLFDELNDKLMRKASKKVKKINSLLKKKEKKIKKVEVKTDTEFDLTMKNKKTVERPDEDVELIEGDENPLQYTPSSSMVYNTSEAPVEIDPTNFIQVNPKKLNTVVSHDATNIEGALDDEETGQMTMEKAFVDDDVIDEFKELKKEEEKANKLEVTTTLPGWGEWGGTGIKPRKRKNKLLVLNLPPRKDKKKKDIIINENENPNLKNHLVKEVPHPFKSVEAFEANIRAPVGRDWVPESAHRKLIQREVETKLGAVIEPMDEDELVSLKKTTRSPYHGKKRNKTS